MLRLTDSKKRIKFLSQAYSGSSHDYALLKKELPPESLLWFDTHQLYVDLGFLGISKDYSAQVISIPFKKSKNNQLTKEQKLANKKMSSIRVKVEHSIGGFKRYRFLSDRLRCRDFQLYNLVAEVCAGLWNFSLTH